MILQLQLYELVTKYKPCRDIHDEFPTYGDILLMLIRATRCISKCQQIARDTIYWPKIDDDIETYIKRCQVCIKAKVSSQSPFSTARSPKAHDRKLEYMSLNGTTNAGSWPVVTFLQQVSIPHWSEITWDTHCHCPSWRSLCYGTNSGWGFHR